VGETTRPSLKTRYVYIEQKNFKNTFFSLLTGAGREVYGRPDDGNNNISQNMAKMVTTFPNDNWTDIYVCRRCVRCTLGTLQYLED
jgi:hypothetical protein